MKQPKALRYAVMLQNKASNDARLEGAAYELVRLHEANQAMLEALKKSLPLVAFAYEKGSADAETVGLEIEAAIAKAEGMNKGEQQ